ncbi:hypothetical protein V1283_003771 [Bradyrhizobium sp. AZCC 2262]|uniref:hypothetical protein n=1 Tax=Bradyrhizobium sp. AZCC 2262 TaxID=3117022 RepID=UPI002FF29534
MSKEFRIPLKLEVKDRKARFEGLNEYVRARHGWLTSVPGARDVTMECLPGSTLPGDLRKLGYTVEANGEGERILPAPITEQLVIGVNGEIEPTTAGSTRAIARTVTHAGIVNVNRFRFSQTG